MFAENLELFGNPASQPEKYNMYQGLINVVQGLSSLEQKVDRIDRELQVLRQAVSSMGYS